MNEPRPLPESGAPYPVRTTRRRGRMSAAKRDAIIDLLPVWTLAGAASDPLTETRLRESFGRAAPRLLDVGVGTGEATVDWAQEHPDHDVVAVELHRPGIARMLQALSDGGPTNVRIIETDITRLLDATIGPGGASDRPRIDAVRVLFPDPWPKARHRSRRLVDAPFVAAVAQLLPVGGRFHLATDWDGYALQMAQVVLADGRFELDTQHATAPLTSVCDLDVSSMEGPLEAPLPWACVRPARPVTVYERRGLQAGRRITDLCARRAR